MTLPNYLVLPQFLSQLCVRNWHVPSKNWSSHACRENFGKTSNQAIMAVRHVRMGGTLLCLLFLVVLLREFRESSNCSFMHPERCTRLVISLHLTTSSAYYKLPFKLASRRFNGGRLLFTATGVGTFQAQRLLIYGDVSPNPGPRKKPTKYPVKFPHSPILL